MTSHEKEIAQAHVKSLPTIALMSYFQEVVDTLEVRPDTRIGPDVREEFGMLRRELEAREVIRFH